jgi:hypothetical protein
VKDVRLDQDGELRCWNCGSKGFTEKRTFRSKALVGVGALLTKKKLKCQVCGEYNDTGNAKPYDGPAARKYRKQYEAEMQARAAGTVPPMPGVTPEPGPGAQSGDKVAQLERLASLHASGALSDEEYASMKAELLGIGAKIEPEFPETAEPPNPA